MNDVLVGVIVVLGLIAVLAGISKSWSVGDTFQRGVACATRILEGGQDKWVRDRLDMSADEPVSIEQRIAYIEHLVDESREFGMFDNFDRGCLFAISDVNNIVGETA